MKSGQIGSLSNRTNNTILSCWYAIRDTSSQKTLKYVKLNCSPMIFMSVLIFSPLLLLPCHEFFSPEIRSNMNISKQNVFFFSFSLSPFPCQIDKFIGICQKKYWRKARSDYQISPQQMFWWREGASQFPILIWKFVAKHENLLWRIWPQIPFHLLDGFALWINLRSTTVSTSSSPASSPILSWFFLCKTWNKFVN